MKNLPFEILLYITILSMFGCGKSEKDQPWNPEIPGISSPSNHGEGTEIQKDVISTQGARVFGTRQGFKRQDEVTFDIPMETELGEAGSLSLIAETEAEGVATALLVSLTDGTGKDYINLTRNGALNCNRFGISNDSCELQQPSAYSSLSIWKRRQGFGLSRISVNTFPTCNWTDFKKTCAFNTDFFEAGKNQLRTGPGVVYRAKYVVFDPEKEYSFQETSVKLTAVKKFAKDTTKRAIDLNVVLVGDKNVRASRTSLGRKNLNSLFIHFANHLNQSNTRIKLGSIRVVEWGSEQNGNPYAQISTADVGLLFKNGSALLPKETENKALNIYLISNFIEGSIAGISGQINGPMLHGTETSGLAFASFNMLDKFNPNCSGETSCSLETQESMFVDMGATFSHEAGHFLGLFHVQEKDARVNDELPDTPHCTLLVRNQNQLMHESCRFDRSKHPVTGKSCEEVCSNYDGKSNFCPENPECEYNHVMWWTSKYYNPAAGKGDGNIFSQASGVILRYSPFVQ